MYAPLLIGDDSLNLDSNKVYVSKIDDVYIKVNAEFGIRQELTEYFTFMVPGAKFMPSYRNKMWDGKIRLYNNKNKQLYAGLVPYVDQFAKERNYSVTFDDTVDKEEVFAQNDASEWIGTLNLPLTPRGYQVDAFIHAVRNNRAMLLSPTASGKSLIIHLLLQWYGVKSLVIVPTTSLVLQMQKDLISYGANPDDIHIVMAGKEKDSDAPIVISTWQSIYNLNKKYFAQYELCIGDEAHQFKAKSLTSIMTKLVNCKYRFGTTGTLDGMETHQLVLEGLFGKVKQVIKTKELIDAKHLAEFKIKALVLKHPTQVCKDLRGKTYQEEIDYIVGSAERNKFITNLTLSLKGNTLLLFQFVEKHGKILHEMIEKEAGERKVFFIYGGTDATDREEVRAIMEKESDAIIVASYGTFSTGINIINLSNIVFASPTKSKIRSLQSIGRGLRRSNTKHTATLLDIADDMSIGAHRNYTLKHFLERMKIYTKEKFKYRIHNIRLK